MRRLEGKAAFVTGAAQGFGQAIAETFAREGAHVVVADLQQDKAEAVAKAIGPNALALRCDVSRAADVEAAAKASISAFGRVDIVVNNAGTTHRNQPMLDVEEAEFDKVFAVNVKSIYLTARAFVPHFRENGGGVIVNIGSTAGIRPRPGLAWYNATKGGRESPHEIHGGRARTRQDPGRGARPGCRRDAAARPVHGRGHAGEAGRVSGEHTVGPPVATTGHRQCGAVSRLGRSVDDYGLGARGRWRTLHLTPR